jgi:hypothetical protein
VHRQLPTRADAMPRFLLELQQLLWSMMILNLELLILWDINWLLLLLSLLLMMPCLVLLLILHILFALDNVSRLLLMLLIVVLGTT